MICLLSTKTEIERQNPKKKNEGEGEHTKLQSTSDLSAPRNYYNNKTKFEAHKKRQTKLVEGKITDFLVLC